MTAAIVERGLAGHPFSKAIEAQLPLDVWDLGVFGYSGGAMTARFKDRADRAAANAVLCLLESRLAEPFADDYADLIAEARRRLGTVG